MESMYPEVIQCPSCLGSAYESDKGIDCDSCGFVDWETVKDVKWKVLFEKTYCIDGLIDIEEDIYYAFNEIPEDYEDDIKIIIYLKEK